MFPCILLFNVTIQIIILPGSGAIFPPALNTGVSATDALNLAIQGDLPTFMEESLG
jgi:hypothetical protein